MSNITEQEKEILRKVNNESEQNKACDEIKSAHGDQYPDDWFEVVILGGLLLDMTIEISSIDPDQL